MTRKLSRCRVWLQVVPSIGGAHARINDSCDMHVLIGEWPAFMAPKKSRYTFASAKRELSKCAPFVARLSRSLTCTPKEGSDCSAWLSKNGNVTNTEFVLFKSGLRVAHLHARKRDSLHLGQRCCGGTRFSKLTEDKSLLTLRHFSGET